MFYYVSIKFVDLMHFIFITYIKLKNLNFFFFLDFIFSIIICVVLILFVLISVAFFTLLERKKLASFQRRRGPNVEGSINGILQPIADGFKLIFKESILPSNSLNKIFILAPIMAFWLGFAGWCFLPFGNYVLSNINYGIFFIFIISILHVYSVILAGWSSNSKYSFFGALRSSAQLIAYDLTIGLIILILFLSSKSLNILDLVVCQQNIGFFLFYYPILFVFFFICSLAETNRHPFDLPEAEAELVSGYNVEYSALGFALFFLGEYAAILFMSMFICNLFLGGSWIFFFQIDYLTILNDFFCFKFFKILLCCFKPTVIIFLFLISRALIPRYRYDQLMYIGWKFLLPLTLVTFIFNLIIFYYLSEIDSFNVIIIKNLS